MASFKLFLLGLMLWATFIGVAKEVVNYPPVETYLQDLEDDTDEVEPVPRKGFIYDPSIKKA